MVAPPVKICLRCGRQNASRARFCAQCGLNLTVASGDDATQSLRPRGKRSGIGVVLFLVLLGLLLATVGSIYRVQPRSRNRPAPRVLQYDEMKREWRRPQPAQPEIEWHLRTYDNQDDR